MTYKYTDCTKGRI